MKFTIKQGSHYTNKRWWIWINKWNRRNVLMYSVVISKNAWYSDNVIAFSGWNKIFGFGGINHHNNSARFVWQPDPLQEGRLLIAAYTYESGTWTAKEFSDIWVENAKNMKIEAVYAADPSQTGYLFQCGADTAFVRHSNPTHNKKLWAYFGGHDRAYKDIDIVLKKIVQF